MEVFRESSSFDDAKMEKTNVDMECKTEDFEEFPYVTIKTEPGVGWPESSAHNDTVTNMAKDDNSQSADIKDESEYPNKDDLPNNTEEGVRRWTVRSSTIMPVDLVKTEESSMLDHGHIGFEPAKLFNVNDSSSLKIQNNRNTGGSTETSALPITISKSKNMKSYMCDICGQEFISSQSLTQHHRSHTGEKSYKCDICNKEFAASSNLKKHHLIHTGKKPYKCDICKKEFTQSGNLTNHQRIHTGEKPYKCDICVKEFAASSHLKRHQRIHTGEKPFKCDVCNKEFTQSSHLTNHQLIHTGEKPYKCDVCHKEFNLSGALTRHKRIHPGEKTNYSKTSELRALGSLGKLPLI